MPALIERPKMSLAMWAALKIHIMRQREKKKQEQEADAAVERLQREQEMKRKQNAMTLEEIKEELAQLEKKLVVLREEKHEMFLYFKRVLNDDDKRRNEEEKEANELMQMSHHYQNQNVPVGAPNLYMIGSGNRVMNRNAVMYKVGTGPPPQQNGTMKRPRSPSPPNSSYPQGYGYKTHVTAYGQTYPIPHPASQYASQEQAKHLAANYHVSHMQQGGYVSGLPGQMDHPSQKPTNMQDEKYYIQAGGISSGYPIRTQPPSHFQPPSSHSVTAQIQVPLRKEDVMRRNMSNEVHR
ncbi:hypothetical protein AVEN_174698-1 [Araneus ventricosus]|uniref:G protein pathway suppressor 2 n=1 Tax=Araneus ventricosus TaxID=182803 RepID=A0A4Y2BLX5_ARAVE|nr:hypothetical protein AVEN_174698-1 [Araneus ventricosus]